MLKAMWCQKDQRRIFLQSCISCDCKQRRNCTAYTAQDAAAEAFALSDIHKHGHHAAVPPLPLLAYNVMGRSPNAAKPGGESGPLLEAHG